jgi:hypothetical protein
MERRMHTESYKVIKSSVSFSPPLPLPTTQITMNVTPTTSPLAPTPIPQLQLLRLNVHSGSGSEIERISPPATLYGQVNLKPDKFDVFKTKLQDALCTVRFDYQSEVVGGNDPINVFQPIYVY